MNRPKAHREETDVSRRQVVSRAIAAIAALALCLAATSCSAIVLDPLPSRAPTAAVATVVSTDTPEPTSTAEPTAVPSLTPTPSRTPEPTPTFEPRSQQEVWIDCKQDHRAEESLVEVREETTIYDMAKDPALPDCYGHTDAEKAQNVGIALEAQEGMVTEPNGGWASGRVLAGIYSLFVDTDRAHAELSDDAAISLVTPTPSPFSLSSFSARVVGYGVHGAMLELLYDRAWSDLEGMTIRADMAQHFRDNETQTFRVVDGRYLAEMTDAMYDLGAIKIGIHIQPASGSAQSTTLELTTRYDRLHPFMSWFYNDSDVSTAKIDVPGSRHPEAYDLAPANPEYPNGLGHPAYLPSEGIVFAAYEIPEKKGYHNMWVYLPDVGYCLQMAHMFPMAAPASSSLPAGHKVGNLTNETGWPHLHTTLRRPLNWPALNPSATQGSEFIDMFNPHVQLGGPQLDYGFWLEDTIPPTLKRLIEENYFVPQY